MKGQANVEQFLDAIEGAGYTPRSYSGRGMYGKVCVGVDLERNQSEADFVLDVMAYLLETATEDVHAGYLLEQVDLMRGSRGDSMGLGSIIYWPNLPWPEGRADGADDDEEAEA